MVNESLTEASFITIPVACLRLGATRMTIINRIKDGTLVAEKKGKHWMINEDSLKNYSGLKIRRL